MPSPFAHFFDRWLPDAIRNLTNNELHSQDAVISWLQEALYENERTQEWRLYFTRRGWARELPPRAPRSARGGRLLPAAPGRATAAGRERQIGEGLGKPGFPSPLPEDDARPDPPAGERMGKPGCPTPLLEGCALTLPWAEVWGNRVSPSPCGRARPSRGQGGEETRLPHPPRRGRMFT